MYDVLIIGAGPAGLTAAIYAGRRALKTLVVSHDIGGQVSKTLDVENYPGVDRVKGGELASRFREQAERFGAEIKLEEVKKITPVENIFQVKTKNALYEAKVVILAFGKRSKTLGIAGEEKFSGRGVTYCATCDAPFFKNKTVVVVGGGNSALDAAVLASSISKKVYLIHRGPEFRGEQYLIDKVKEAPNVETIFNDELSEILGDASVRSVKLKSGAEIPTDGVMVEVGYVVDRSLAENLVELDSRNQVVVDQFQQTSMPGIFAAGDLTPTPFKQIVIAAGEGAKSALSAFDYLQKAEGKRGIAADWH